MDSSTFRYLATSSTVIKEPAITDSPSAVVSIILFEHSVVILDVKTESSLFLCCALINLSIRVFDLLRLESLHRLVRIRKRFQHRPSPGQEPTATAYLALTFSANAHSNSYVFFPCLKRPDFKTSTAVLISSLESTTSAM